MKDIDREVLIPIYLHYDTGSKSLKVRALAVEVVRVIHNGGKLCQDFNQIDSSLRKRLGVKGIEPSFLLEALTLLTTRGYIHNEGGQYCLTDSEASNIKYKKTEAQNNIDKTIDKFFPLEKFTLDERRSWFLDTSTVLFSSMGALWVTSLVDTNGGTRKSGIESIRQIINTTSRRHGLEKDVDFLVEGYEAFIKDHQSPESTSLKWAMMEAAISTKYIASAFSADPLLSDEFQNATFFLDTNVLFLIVLESHKSSPSLVQLGEVLKEMGVTLKIIAPTREEYKRVVRRNKESTIKALGNGISADLLEMSTDEFVRTAVGRMCQKKEDFETFFTEISEPPKQLCGIKIELEEYPDSQIQIDKAISDLALKSKIRYEWRTKHLWEKSDLATEHDAALNRVAEYHRDRAGEDGRVWIITRDRTMQGFGAKYGRGIWLSMETLIHILAVYGSGSKYRPELFAELLSTLLESELFSTNSDFFEIQDWNYLVEIEERVKELTPQEILVFTKKLKQMRLNGQEVDDNEIKLELRRVFQKTIAAKDEEVRKAKERADKESQSRINDNTQAIVLLASEIESRLRLYIIVWGSLRVLLSAILFFGFIWLAWYAFHNEEEGLAIVFMLVSVIQQTNWRIDYQIKRILSDLKSVKEKSINEATKKLKNK